MRTRAWSSNFLAFSSSTTLFPLLVRATDYNPRILNPTVVKSSDRKGWCSQQTENCPLICRSSFVELNNCNFTTLDFECECDNPDIDISDYQDTLPWQVCKYLQINYQKIGEEYPGTCGGSLAVPRPSVSTMNNNRESIGGFNPESTQDPAGVGGPNVSHGGQVVTSTTTTLVEESTTSPFGVAITTGSDSNRDSGTTVIATFVAASVSPTSSVTSHSSSSKGLAPGAKAGIAIGAVAGAALLGMLIFFLLRNKRRKKAELLPEESKSLGIGPSTVSQDPYTDSPGNASGQPTRYSWAQSPPAPMTAVPAIHNPQQQQPLSQPPYGQPASRDIAPEEAAAGYWQPPTNQSSLVSPQNRHSDVIAPRTSMQEARPAISATPLQYTAYSPAANPAPVAQRSVGDDWDEDERRLEAEIAEIERMRQLREERAALR